MNEGYPNRRDPMNKEEPIEVKHDGEGELFKLGTHSSGVVLKRCLLLLWVVC